MGRSEISQRELGRIEVLAASSPQANGRVERGHGTHQDRLVKKLRRQNNPGHEQANACLEAEYLPEHNRRFARQAARPEDYHRRAPRAAELDPIFRLESKRTISEDWVVRYDNRFFQMEPQSRHYAPARCQVPICKGREGNLAIKYRGRGLPWREIPPPVRPQASQVTRVGDREVPRVAAGSCGGKRMWVPSADHPRRQAAARGHALSGSGLRSGRNPKQRPTPKATTKLIHTNLTS